MRKSTRAGLILLTSYVAALTLIGCAARREAPLKNVILFIGDGMGPAQVQAARMYNGGPLSFETFPHHGRVTTYAANSAVTDSAAAATSLATGRKVNNGVISLAIPGDGSDPPQELTTLLEYFQAQGKSTGLVSTAHLTHATPAAFGAHEPSRGNLDAIAADFLTQTRPDILLGGGGGGMSPAAATAAGYLAFTDRSGLQTVVDDGETVPRICGLFGEGHMPYEYDQAGQYKKLPHLSEMTEIALRLLDNDEDGLFLMVEAGRIDHAGHGNNIGQNIHETIEFAKAVRKAMDWATKRKDTLIVLTADHETGGLEILADGGTGAFPKIAWSTTGHTATNVPVYAWGANAHTISGRTIDNTDIFNVIRFGRPGPVEGSAGGRTPAAAGTGASK